MIRASDEIIIQHSVVKVEDNQFASQEMVSTLCEPRRARKSIGKQVNLCTTKLDR